jgi:hypothetical protein
MFLEGREEEGKTSEKYFKKYLKYKNKYFKYSK